MKKMHKYLGFIMILPFISWAVTGGYFFIKPGYKAAYESLNVKTYPLALVPKLNHDKTWLEVRLMRSILGVHLLVKSDKGWQQHDLHTLKVIDKPLKAQVESLTLDAIAINPHRYGKIKSIQGLDVITDTDTRITLNWPQMRFYQQGKDTDFINKMYQIHYLQWTGIKALDDVLGFLV